MANILFIGGPIDSLPSLGKAKSLGYNCFIVDGDPDCPGLRWASRYGNGLVASTYDADMIITLVKYAGWKIDGVVSIGCDVGPVVSLVSEGLGLKNHIPYETALLSWDKRQLKDRLRQSGIPVPSLVDIVVKPSNGRGSRGLNIVAASNISGSWVDWAREQSPGGEVMFEQYIRGPQVSTESIVYRGQAYTYLTDRDYSQGIYEVGGWGPSKWETEPPFLGRQPEAVRIRATVQRAVNALGVTEGCVKGDLVLNEEYGLEPTVIELALGRISGGNSAVLYLALGYGIDFIGAVLALACGDNPLPFLEPKGEPRFVRGVFEMRGVVTCNKDRGRFHLSLGRTREEAERKAGEWVRRQNGL